MTPRSFCAGPNSIVFSRLRFTLMTEEPAEFTGYKGGLLRGCLGAALKRVSCCEHDLSCHSCSHHSGCAYGYAFESVHSDVGDTGESKDKRLLGTGRQASNDPPPLVLEPPLAPKSDYAPGDRLVFSLVMIGKGIRHLPFFIIAVADMAHRGLGGSRSRFELEKVEDEFDGSRRLLCDSISQRISQRAPTLRSLTDARKETEHLRRTRVELLFMTPTRIRHRVGPPLELSGMLPDQSDARLISSLDFVTFMRALLRRLSWLAEAHCGQPWCLDYAALLAKAESQVRVTGQRLRWQDWERYSSRQNTRLKMGGFVGSITFEGDLEEFLPYIKLGEYLHIGQGTTFGLGKYVIAPAR